MNEKIKQKSFIQITTLISIFAFAISVFAVILSMNVYKSEFRPYVGLKGLELLALNPNYFEIRTILENKGRVPANNVKIEAFQVLEDGSKQLFPGDATRQGLVLMPLSPFIYTLSANTNDLDSLIYSDRGWSIILQVKYDGIVTKNHTSFMEAKYDPDLEAFDITKGFAN